ncbi:MAG: alkaline phosphatase family protein [Candidatus Cybelea sp.]
MTIRSIALLALACAAAGCGRSFVSPAPNALTLEARRSRTPIQHVVYIVQENRSFNNLFEGFPNALTASYGYDSKGKKIELRPHPLGTEWDVGHSSLAYFTACDGQGKLKGTDCKMDGWLGEGANIGAPKNPEYSYIKRSQIVPYWTMAKQYVLADRMFASNLDGSFIAHQYVVAAFASHAVDYPIGSWGCEGGASDMVGTLTDKRKAGPSILACFGNPTIASEADSAQLSWRFYTTLLGAPGGLWSAYQADSQIYYGHDWKTDVITPQSQFLTDIGKGELASITWITPTWAASDHPGMDATEGPAWVASVVNAVGKSKFWKSTAIFVQWDDWGGMFDPVQPVFEDYDGLGFRVPLIVISPYAKKGRVTHVQYETASVLRYIEDNFGLGRLAASDTRANDPANDSDVFDYSQPPRKFKEIAGSKPASYWKRLEQTLPPRMANIIGDD